VEADFDGDGVIDLTTTDMSDLITYTYTESGIYQASLVVTDDYGDQYKLDQTIAAVDRAEVSANLRSVYEGMLAALSDGDIPAALNHVTGSTRQRYERLFSALQPDMGNIVAGLGVVEGDYVNGDMAELLLVSEEGGERIAYFVEMLRGEDGVWRIEGM
jgi:hypothetical protein